MGDELGGLIAGLMVLGLVIACLATLMVAVLVVLVLVGPTVGCAYWLRSLLRRYELSSRKKRECVLIGLTLFSLPFFLVVICEGQWPVALCLGSLLGLSSVAIFLSIEGYRQVFWPHRKAAWEAHKRASELQSQTRRTERTLQNLQQDLARQEERHRDMLSEYLALKVMVRDLVREHDPEFYSAERLRWQRKCAALQVDQLIAELDQLKHNLAQMHQGDPRYPTLTLRAAVVRLEAQNKLLGVGKGTTYQEDVRRRHKLQEDVSLLRSNIQAEEQRKRDQLVAIGRLKHKRVALN